MMTVWKYPVPLGFEAIQHDIPGMWVVVKVAEQNGVQQMWCLCNTAQPARRYTFRWFATGEEIPESDDEEWYHIDTVLVNGGEYVYHLFERSRIDSV